MGGHISTEWGADDSHQVGRAQGATGKRTIAYNHFKPLKGVKWVVNFYRERETKRGINAAPLIKW